MPLAKCIFGALLLLLSIAGLSYLGKGVSLRLNAAAPVSARKAGPPPASAPDSTLNPWEQQTIQRLAALRYALYAYKSENGVYPDNLAALVPIYLPEIPPIKTGEKERFSAAVRYSSGDTLITNAGGWAYVNDRRDPGFGSVFINSYGRDSEGAQWFAR